MLKKFELKKLDVPKLVNRFQSTRSRLILLDFDGTLVPFQLDPKEPMEVDGVKSIVSSLAADPKNRIIIVSGRDRDYLDLVFGGANFALAAEHGAFYKDPITRWQSMFVQPGGWIQKTLPALNSLAFQYEGSIVEEKAYSVAWHYRAVATKIGEADIHQILAAIRSLPEYDQFIVSESEFTIELRTPGVDKGAFLAKWVKDQRFDFVLAIGDSETDEDMFKIFDADSYTVKVGSAKHTSANFYLRNQKEVLPLLRRLLSKTRERVFV